VLAIGEVPPPVNSSILIDALYILMSFSGNAMESPVPCKQHICQHTLTSGAPEEMFSPTSAAAWALSTMHHVGASASPPLHNNAPRPNVKALTGTRLFNSGVGNGTTRMKSKGTNLPSSLTIFPQAPVAPMSITATEAITWGNLSVHPVVSVRSEAFAWLVA
jgi:hypothetical protein